MWNCLANSYININCYFNSIYIFWRIIAYFKWFCDGIRRETLESCFITASPTSLEGETLGWSNEKFKNKTEGKGEVPKKRKAKFIHANAKCEWVSVFQVDIRVIRMWAEKEKVTSFWILEYFSFYIPYLYLSSLNFFLCFSLFQYIMEASKM